MKNSKKIFFSVVTVTILFLFLEVVSRVVWGYLGAKAFDKSWENLLRNDKINYMKQIDKQLGYVLKPNFKKGDQVINSAGFSQPYEIPIQKSKKIRILSIGESTTQGNDSISSNYPIQLRDLLEEEFRGQYEVINAGVAGWVSDQLLINTQNNLIKYKPDIVIFYAGWNDFQSYSPVGPVPNESYFETIGKSDFVSGTNLKSLEIFRGMILKFVPLLSTKVSRTSNESSTEGPVTPARTYKFFLENMDQMIESYRQAQPETRIIVSNLVGRWGSADKSQYVQTNGSVWWMKQSRITESAAEEFLNDFNKTLENHVRNQNVEFVNMSSKFSPSEKASMQWDFAHFNTEGYSKMATIFFKQILGSAAGAK